MMWAEGVIGAGEKPGGCAAGLSGDSLVCEGGLVRLCVLEKEGPEFLQFCSRPASNRGIPLMARTEKPWLTP